MYSILDSNENATGDLRGGGVARPSPSSVPALAEKEAAPRASLTIPSCNPNWMDAC